MKTAKLKDGSEVPIPLLTAVMLSLHQLAKGEQIADVLSLYE